MRAAGALRFELERSDAQVVVGVLERTALAWARLTLEQHPTDPPARPGLRDRHLALIAFTEKLRKASARRGGAAIRPATIVRTEGRRAFEWLSLYFHPAVPADILSRDDLEAVRRVTLALAIALAAKPHRPRTPRDAAERFIAAVADPRFERDPRHARRLRRRLEHEERVLGRPVPTVPGLMIAALAGKVPTFRPPA